MRRRPAAGSGRRARIFAAPRRGGNAGCTDPSVDRGRRARKNAALSISATRRNSSCSKATSARSQIWFARVRVLELSGWVSWTSNTATPFARPEEGERSGSNRRRPDAGVTPESEARTSAGGSATRPANSSSWSNRSTVLPARAHNSKALGAEEPLGYLGKIPDDDREVPSRSSVSTKPRTARLAVRRNSKPGSSRASR